MSETRTRSYSNIIVNAVEEDGLKDVVKDDKENTAPDGGFGWFVTIGQFLIMGFYGGFLKSLTVFFVPLRESFGATNSQITMAVTLMPCMFLSGGVLSSKLYHLCGTRVVGLIGGLLTTIGFIMAAFSTEIYQLCIGFAVSGLGYNFGLISSSVAVSQWFSTKRPLALSIGFTGISLFCIVFPLLFVFLEGTYGARGALLIYAGITAHSCIGGALLRPVPNKPPPPPKRNTLKVFAQLLKRPEYVLFSIGSCFVEAGKMTFNPYLMPFATEYVGLDKQVAAQMLMFIATLEIIVRPGAGYLWTMDFAREKIGLLGIFGFFSVLLGVIDILAPLLITNMTSFAVYAAVFATVNAAPISLTTACYAEVVPMNLLSDALALTCLLECAGVFGMPMLAGYLADTTNNMGVPLYVAGVLICLGGISNIAANIVNKRRKRAQLNAVQQSGQKQSENPVNTVCE